MNVTANNNQEKILNYKYHIDIGAKKQTIENIYPYEIMIANYSQIPQKILECEQRHGEIECFVISRCIIAVIVSSLFVHTAMDIFITTGT